MSTTTVVYRDVRYTVRRARKPHRCAEITCPAPRIEPGDTYVHLTAMPGHEHATPWDVIRRCSDCAERLASLDTPSAVLVALDAVK